MTIVSMHCKQQAQSLTFVWSVRASCRSPLSAALVVDGGRSWCPTGQMDVDGPMQRVRISEFSLQIIGGWQYVKDTHVRPCPVNVSPRPLLSLLSSLLAYRTIHVPCLPLVYRLVCLAWWIVHEWRMFKYCFKMCSLPRLIRHAIKINVNDGI